MAAHLSPPLRIAVIGAGWAGLASALACARQGHRVTLYEMASDAGGRARSTADDLDNGQHILIGAYSATLELMHSLGLGLDEVLHRQGLEMVDPQGRGLSLPQGAGLAGLVWGAWRRQGWSLADKLSLMRSALSWQARGFECSPALTVSMLCRGITPAVMEGLIEPLCVAALNTPAAQASGSVFLRVLQDALFGARGACDLLLPRKPLSQVLPQAAVRDLQRRGAVLRWRHRVQRLQMRVESEHHKPVWRVDDDDQDRVILACTSTEAARLAQPHNPGWAAQAQAIPFESIVTTYLKSPGTRWRAPMLMFNGNPRHPAQFAFDLTAIGHPLQHHFAFVVSAANAWLEQDLEQLSQAVLQQALHTPGLSWHCPPTLVRSLAARRATFVCAAGLQRPPATLAPGLLVAGDYVEGPYPATLEGAVRSGLRAAFLIQAEGQDADDAFAMQNDKVRCHRSET